MAIDGQVFRSTLARWASGVSVVTSLHDGQRVGITASSFTSVSLEPPRILICVAKRLFTHHVIEESGFFAVNILTTEQLEWGMRFAGLLPEQEDRFEGIATTTAATGAPGFPDVLGWVDCRLMHAYDGGDHTIFVGQVEAAHSTTAGEPLLYFSRQWRQLDGDPLAL